MSAVDDQLADERRRLKLVRGRAGVVILVNEWKCDAPGCKYKCIGLGGAIGLRAIGWWFLPGPLLYCPRHRPDPIPCVDKYSDGNHGNSCALCAGEVEAEKIQSRIPEILETVT